jgi:hypothetical protein
MTGSVPNKSSFLRADVSPQTALLREFPLASAFGACVTKVLRTNAAALQAHTQHTAKDGTHSTPLRLARPLVAGKVQSLDVIADNDSVVHRACG